MFIHNIVDSRGELGLFGLVVFDERVSQLIKVNKIKYFTFITKYSFEVIRITRYLLRYINIRDTGVIKYNLNTKYDRF